MPLKLKFVIDVLYKILKFSNLDDINLNKNLNSMEGKFNKLRISPSLLNSGRISIKKNFSQDLQSIPQWESLTDELSTEEKEELITSIKGIDTSILATILTTIANKQFYFKIKTKLGLEVLKSKYKELLSEMEIYNDMPYITDECELFLLLKDILTVTEYEVMEIFDLFKHNQAIAFNEMNFIVLVYINAAKECDYLEDFFKILGEETFSFISGGEDFISLSKLKDLGRILSFSEDELYKTANDLHYEISTSINIEKFISFYSKLTKKVAGVVTKDKPAYNFGKKKKLEGVSCIYKGCNII